MRTLKFLSGFKDQIYAIMRIVSGFLFMCHGIQKDIWLFKGTIPPDNILMLIAAAIESIGGLLILTGFLTHWAAFIASGEMAVAYFKAHAPAGFFPIDNRGELAVFYCFVFLLIAAYGSGIWSIDRSGGSNPIPRFEDP